MTRLPLLTWVLLFVTAPFFAQSLPAENWPQFRGPEGNGHSIATNLPEKWSDSNNVAWKIPLAGEGWSSPIIWDGRIYLTAAVPTGNEQSRDRSLRTLCIAADTGKEIWNIEVFRQGHEESFKIHNKNSHASGTPLTDGERLYVHFGPQGTACLAMDGTEIWQNREHSFDPQHGTGGSPILVDDLIVFNCDGNETAEVVALDRFTGKLRWKTSRPAHDHMQKFAFCTPILIEVDGKKQIFSPGAYVAAAYAPKDGREIWRVDHPGFSVVPRPLYVHNHIYMATSFLQSELLVIDPTGEGDVTKSHISGRIRRGAPHTPSPLIVDENLYLFSDDGIATCLDAVTGKEYWKKRIPGNYSSSPLYAEGKIYIANETGLCVVLEEGRKFKKLAQNPMKERVFASFAPLDGALIIRGEENLYRINSDE
ncbi:outer membrane biogenesis protein BamB [Polystyrenella longa]|uniref:Outer membrane biogenesis protein BamB n=1 Tax=Polystyrenella longa TaxID=2528007 RepID=A0A518CKM2_9PLAN|nr:PQQ-binding-like beta-propeller repeat protein [Polystyrenella longa]QDU79771.1 outer membrane biogenesis protein BamB [Polystyrenella longa]